jgi:hypothetical protein
MLADDVIASCGGPADQIFAGAVTALAHEIKRAARFDLTPGVMLSAQTVHRSHGDARMRALPLCRLPFARTWFEWPGHDPSGAEPRVVGPDRFAPVPRRVGALVSVDDSRQRGTMTWAWFTKQEGQGINVCPLSVTFDWREDFEPVDDLVNRARVRHGMSKEQYNDIGYRHAISELPHLRGIQAEKLNADRERFGIVWSPYASTFAQGYERRNGPIDPTHSLWKYSLGDITGEPGMLQCVLLLLNSRNMTAAEVVPAPERLNRQRLAKGKGPLLGYTTIRIKLTRALTQRAGAVGERSPARMHVVSGHFKVRKSGVYWWNDHARGDPTQGIVRQQTRKVMP